MLKRMTAVGWADRFRRRNRRGSSRVAGWSGLQPLEPRLMMASDVFITELIYHPSHVDGAEDTRQEWIELYNAGPDAADLTGWQLDAGVNYTFPSMMLGAGQYLVVAADTGAFSAKYPSVTNVVGGWDGRLSNAGERIDLEDGDGNRVDMVEYADSGDWAPRRLVVDQYGHAGWEWQSEADGGGSSLELINLAVTNNQGQNWTASAVMDGTPGAANSVADTDIAPLIVDASHFPVVPHSTDAVTVTASIRDELATGVTATLHYRLDQANNTDPFTQVSMHDDGLNGDAAAGDGIYTATIPAQANGSIVEFYVRATDAALNSRTWPAASDDMGGQNANALYLVDNAFSADYAPGDQPLLHLIMTEDERARLEDIGDTDITPTDEDLSDAQMNGTFIEYDGTGLRLTYQVGIRNRGHNTRHMPPMNYRVNFPGDALYRGENEALNLNTKYTHSQLAGQVLFQMAGLIAPDALAVQGRVNGVNLVASDPSRTFGSYVQLEALNSDFADAHFPGDGGGNLYRAVRIDSGEGEQADLTYLGTDPDAYRAFYRKTTNEAADDWNDLIQLTDVLNNAPDETFLADVEAVVNVDQWLRYIAFDALMGNGESGLNTGQGDDFAFYRGVDDPRFVLIPHDLDTILDQGNTGGDPDRDIFIARQVNGLTRLLTEPSIVQRYYETMLDLIDTFFNPATINPLLDQALGDWVSQTNINEMKQFVIDRTDGVLAQIPLALTISSPLPVVNGYPRTTLNETALNGTASVAGTQSVLVNGQPAVWDVLTGTWSIGQVSGSTDTLVNFGSNWRYLDDGSNQGTLWRNAGFDDSSWAQGPAELGYGDGDEATVVSFGPSSTNKYITTYFRRSFTVTDAAEVNSLTLSLKRDDGAAVYLNGVEVALSNLPTNPAFNALATDNISGSEETEVLTFSIDPALLNEGLNILAVEIHQDAADSSDITFDLRLTADRGEAEGVGLNPGINRVIVETFDGPNGTGNRLAQDYIDIHYDDGSVRTVSGVLEPTSENGTPNLITGDVYMPGVPFLVRVEMLDEFGNVNRDLWDALATLSITDRPDLQLSVELPGGGDEIPLYNGLGSALVTISSTAGGGSATQTLIAEGSVWKYLDDGSNQGTAWRSAGFDDTSWDSGPAKLGYGEGDEATVVGFIDTDPGTAGTQRNATTYFRHSFNVADPSNFTTGTITLTYDDAAAIYLNGVEVLRTANLPANAAFNTFATADSPGDPAIGSFTIPVSALVAGTNVIAVEVHQGDAGSSDIGMDLELTVEEFTGELGDFTLAVDIDGQQVTKAIRSVENDAVTSVSGVLPGSTTWSGVIHVTGDVTVPAGATLTIDPGTLILIDGLPVSGGVIPENATQIIVQGAVQSLGTAAQPVTFTASNPDAAWGWIIHNNAAPSLYQYTVINRAGHQDRMGHTNTGPAIRPIGSTITFDHSSITDIAGKTMQSSGGSQINFLDSLIARSAMGPETSNTGLLIEDTWFTEMLGIYREDGITDDNDAIYIHDAAAPLIMRNSVVAVGDDDGIDTADAELLIENTIVRDWFDKGVSVNDGVTTITGSLIVGNGIGVETKVNAGGTAGSSVIDFSTIVDNDIAIRRETVGAAVIEVFVTNSILQGISDTIDSDGVDADVHIDYSLLGEAWAGVGNLVGDPMLVDPMNHNYDLSAASGAIDAADPGAALDPDGTRADMGWRYFDQGGGGAGGGTTIVWSAAAGPYHVVGDVIVPAGMTFIIEPGTTIFMDAGVEITVNGIIKAQGTKYERIRMTALPSAPLVPDVRPELPDAPPKSRGFQLVDTMSDQNIISYTDVHHAQSSDGAIGVEDSQLIVDNVSFFGTRLRMINTDASNMIIRNSVFPDMFLPTDAPQSMTPPLDNVSEHVKGVGLIPLGGHYIIENNIFGTNKGHNDNIDVDSHNYPNPVLQILNNVFMGAGDEAYDGGGDVLLEGNTFLNFIKDIDNDGTGDSNVISTGDTLDTTMAIIRNTFYNNDHVVNFKNDSFGWIENNTVARITAPHLSLPNDTPIRLLDFSVVNFLIPNISNPTGGTPRDPAGKGAYTAGNIYVDIPQTVFGHVDMNGNLGPIVTDIEVHDSLVEDPSVFANADGINGRQFFYIVGDARLVDPANGDFTLGPGSAAVGTGPNGLDMGALVPGGASISGIPHTITHLNDASITFGGPGIFSFMYKLDDGPWSEEIEIWDPTDTEPGAKNRTVTINFIDLPEGTHTIHARGRNFAGVMQSEADATVSRSWTIDADHSRLLINEVLAANNGSFNHEGTTPDAIELYNDGATPIDLEGMSISDDPSNPTKFAFPVGTILGPGEYLTLIAGPADGTSGIHLGFALSENGEGVYLYDTILTGHQLLDSIEFGLQLDDHSLGRTGPDRTWGLNQPTIGSDNVAQRTGNPATLKINEWFVSGEVAFLDDFIELYNPDPLPVSLTGLTLTDDPVMRPGRHVFGPFSFVDGGGFRVMEADGNTDAGQDHTNFSLAAERGMIGLFDGSGKQIDKVIYLSQMTDVSQGRVPDGATPYAYFTLPTPGSTNATQIITVDQVDLIEVDSTWSYDQSGGNLGTAWKEPGFDDSAWSDGQGLLGFETSPGALPDTIRTTLTAGATTYYFRTHFTLDVDPAEADITLALTTIIDDGAVFYLNGVEVFRLGMGGNIGDPVAFDQLAGRTVDNAATEGPFSIPTAALVQGDNVLAVEVHQRTTGSSDMILGAALEATITTTEILFDDEAELIDSLRITEIHYNPAGPDDTEFIELKNVGGEAIDLEGVRLDDAVNFTFPAMTLDPGQFVLVVRDQAAFEARYGAGFNIAGQFTGQLDNGGERIVLRLPEPFEAAILRFDYDDAWYPLTDGDGFTLVIRDDTAERNTWNDSASWRASYSEGGSPGADDLPEAVAPRVTGFAALPIADNDQFTLTFSEYVGDSLAAADMLLQNVTFAQVISPADIVVDYQTVVHVATVTFGGSLAGGVIPDGRYELTLNAPSVTDRSGNALDGDGDGTGGDDYTIQFIVAIPGDLNFDGTVGINDLSRLATNFGTGSGAIYEQGDIDGDGDVDITDLSRLATRFGQSRPAPGAGAGGGGESVNLLDEAAPAPTRTVDKPRVVIAPIALVSSPATTPTTWNHIGGVLSGDDDAADLLR